MTGSREPPDAVGIRLVLRPSEHGLAGSFLALGMDGRRWWVKPPHQGDPDRGLVTEFVFVPVPEPGVIGLWVLMGGVFGGRMFVRGGKLEVSRPVRDLDVGASLPGNELPGYFRFVPVGTRQCEEDS